MYKFEMEVTTWGAFNEAFLTMDQMMEFAKKGVRFQWLNEVNGWPNFIWNAETREALVWLIDKYYDDNSGDLSHLYDDIVEVNGKYYDDIIADIAMSIKTSQLTAMEDIRECVADRIESHVRDAICADVLTSLRATNYQFENEA